MTDREKADWRNDGGVLVTYGRDRALGEWLLIAAGVVEAAMLVAVLVT
jgi:hypothetical protein